MIAFVVVTSIVNIALGYALAVYLGRAATSSAPGETAISAAPSVNVVAQSVHSPMQPRDLAWPVDGVAAAAPAVAVRALAERPGDAIGAMNATNHPAEDEELHVRTAEMEQELLAGIEEFRNQLSQLKGQGVEGVVHNPLAISATS